VEGDRKASEPTSLMGYDSNINSYFCHRLRDNLCGYVKECGKMSVIDEYRRKLSEKATETTVILSNIADIEKRLAELKIEVTEIYEELDDILDMEIKK